MKQKKWMKRCFAGGIVFAIIIFILSSYHDLALSAEILLMVEEQKIGLEEYRMIMERQKSNVYNYFTSLHKIQPGDLNWEETYEGDSPVAMLIQKTNEKLIENNLILWNAKEKNITDVISFGAFKQMYEQEKIRRKETQENGEVVYGPLELDLYEYYDYYIEEIKAKLAEIVYQEKNLTVEQLKAYYEAEKDVLFVKNKEAKALRFYAEAADTDQHTQEKMLQFLAYAAENPGGRERLLTYASENKLNTEEIEFTEKTQHYDTRIYPELRKVVLEGKEGEITEITRNGNTLDVALIGEISEVGFYSYEEVSVSVEKEYMRKLFQEQMDSWKESSKIKQGKGLKENIQKVLREE